MENPISSIVIEISSYRQKKLYTLYHRICMHYELEEMEVGWAGGCSNGSYLTKGIASSFLYLYATIITLPQEQIITLCLFFTYICVYVFPGI